MRWKFRWLAACSLVLSSATGLNAAAAEGAPWADGAPREIAAPHYGDTLFRYYQDQVFGSLTSLMVSQHFTRLGTHAAEAELLRGGLLLSYGQHEEAASVFTQLINTTAQPAVRDRAWYFLALARQQRGLLAQAEEALGRIAAPLPGTLQIERQLLHAQLLMARREFAGAAAALEGVQGDSMAARYARYNLAVAQVQQGSPALRERGLALLETLGQQAASDEEGKALRDRANIARGYAALQDQQPREARVALQRVRLNGVQANQALLGYGWAAMGLNDPKLALVPWQELAARPEGDAAVLEARLAVPYAQGEIGAFASALQGYQAAAAAYAQEQRAIDSSIAAVREGRFIQTLLANSPGEGWASFSGVQALPAAPHAAHLLPLLASHPFHEGLKNLRDLQFASANSQHWLQALGSFDDMLENRRKAYAERLPQVLAQRGAAAIAELQKQREELAAELAQADKAADGRAYANGTEQRWQQSLQRSRETLAAAAEAQLENVDAAAIAHRLRLAEGVLTWQLAQQLPARSWEAKKALRDTDATLKEARAHEAALAAAQQTEPARQAAFAQRIAALRVRLQAMAPQALALGKEQQQVLQALAVDELQQQQERLKVYAAQAQLAIAQIQDSAQFARQGQAEKAELTR
jgi:hypothetical protein